MKSSIYPWRVLCLISVVSLMGGCCTLTFCPGIDHLDSIRFHGFKPSDLSSVVIKYYPKKSGFNRVLDSMVVDYTETLQAEFYVVTLPEKLTIDYDYVVELPEAGITYELTDFSSKRESCNTGFLCVDHYDKLDSYRVNGTVISGTSQLALRR